MKILITVLGLSFGCFALAENVVPMAPKTKTQTQTQTDQNKTQNQTQNVTVECPPMATPAPNKEEDCTKPKPKPKPKAKPVPKAKPCPEVKCKPCVCKPCEPKVIVKDRIVETERVVEKPVEKVKYIDRTVTIDNAPKSTFNVLVGVGPHGLVTDSYQTEERKDEYAVRKERDKSIGGVLGVQYQYRFSSSLNANGMILSNQTMLLGGGFSW